MTVEFGEWLDQEITRRGWSQSEVARRGIVSPSAVQQVIAGITKPGPKICRAVAKAFEMSPEEVFRMAGLLPTAAAAAPRVRARRIVYEADIGDRILALWRGLTPEDQALVLNLLERLAAVEPRIIGDDT